MWPYNEKIKHEEKRKRKRKKAVWLYMHSRLIQAKERKHPKTGNQCNWCKLSMLDQSQRQRRDREHAGCWPWGLAPLPTWAGEPVASLARASACSLRYTTPWPGVHCSFMFHPRPCTRTASWEIWCRIYWPDELPGDAHACIADWLSVKMIPMRVLLGHWVSGPFDLCIWASAISIPWSFCCIYCMGGWGAYAGGLAPQSWHHRCAYITEEISLKTGIGRLSKNDH